MLSETDWTRLTRYVAGEGSSFERSRTERWIQEDPERQRVYAELREIWSTARPRGDADEAWTRFARTLESESANVRETGRDRSWTSRVLPYRRRVALARAAVIILLVVVGGLLAHRFGLRSSPEESRWEAGQSYVTQTGELVRTSLPDGTEVVVGVQSRLQLASDFGVDTREVRVRGEVFFRVRPDFGRPFTVHTAEARTRVLGTSFSVNSRDSGTETVVQEGTVRITPVNADGEAMELSAGQLGLVLPEGRLVEVTRVDLDARLAWLERRLVFRNAAFGDILERLELWYDIELRVDDDELSGRRLSASLEHPPLGDLLSAIAVAADASYYRDEGTVTFVPR